MFEAAQFIAPIRLPDELIYLQITLLHYLADLSIFSGLQLHVQPHIGGQGSVDLDPEGPVLLPVDENRLRHFAQFLVGDPAMHLDPVESGQVGSGVLQQVLQLHIIGEQEQPLRVEVEPAHRHDVPVVLEDRRQDLVDVGPVLWVPVRADVAPGLVHHPQPSEWLLHPDAQVRECAHVGILGYEQVAVDPAAIHPDQTQPDELLSVLERAQGLYADPLGQLDHGLLRGRARLDHLLAELEQVPPGKHSGGRVLYYYLT